MKRFAILLLLLLPAALPCAATEAPTADAEPADTPAAKTADDPLAALAQTHTLRSLGMAVVEAEEASFHLHRGGRAVKTLPFGTCVLMTKWLDADGLLWRRGTRSLPFEGAVKPVVSDGRFEGWEPVVLLDGARGWMRGPTLAAVPLTLADIRPIARPLTVASLPTAEAASEAVLADKPAVPADLVKVLPPNAEPGRLPALWVRVAALPAGERTVSGWVRFRHVETNPTAAQLYAADCWRRTRRPKGWYGVIDAPDHARRMLSTLAGGSARRTFLHPGAEGGPPRESHARYVALFRLADMAVDAGDTARALQIYNALGMESDRYRVYQGTVPACAVYERAMLHFRQKQYEEALAAFRTMVTEHAGDYTPPPGGKRRDVQAVGVIRALCVRFLDAPARWDNELAALDAAVEDPALRKAIEALKGE